jgi:hypothetical protein
MQSMVVIAVVAACVLWLGYQGYCYFKPKAGKICGGGCCDGEARPPETPGQRTMMISSDDLRHRLRARRR